MKTNSIALLLFAAFAARAQTNSEPPREWIDADTGHRVIRLSNEPHSESFYFNVNPFTPDGRTMVFTTPGGLSAVNLRTRAVEKIVDGRVRVILVGHKTGRVFYTKLSDGKRVVCATDPATKETSQIAVLPPDATASAVNADETIIAGTFTEPVAGSNDFPQSNGEPNPNSDSVTKSRARNIDARFEQHIPMDLFFLNVQSGEIKKYDHCTDWLNHLQFSPVDPGLLMFCHEGPWHRVDRIWTIRTDGSGMALVHKRTMNMEIAGHEFFGADGNIWFDLQTPRGEDFWVAGYNVADGQRQWWHLQRNEWSVHFNVSPDGKLFAGDGGSSRMVAHAPDGQWIYLFRPRRNTNDDAPISDSDKLIHAGVFQSERLVNMSKHNYSLEPNVMFTPDGKWLIFRSNMFGPSHVYEVEIAKG